MEVVARSCVLCHELALQATTLDFMGFEAKALDQQTLCKADCTCNKMLHGHCLPLYWLISLIRADVFLVHVP